ncbi:MAG: methylenetetrahydrofolate--tRNA-(uracil-5-)-methyltransferase [Moorella sp. (in: firmicutes)]|uniref:methylenetetrahydrofolate--tRNA-(uracil(54)- C(5))-methyltransferase (FADH(2)-oxidizing) TrmFO n=1 Tax=unclassified Neomoorella TaxID=2676739 RepID=UPI0010FFBA16|nr:MULTISPECIES: methylenetetrahydrofolate--tRNA-(uracil(54)-C(5))-methyltransferase (FADH(2)-oxidizing) TrmFO [unclassified Moorella (in: firmicutes)]MDK2815498.1 methylenetetrahydrofolate--tRNA-(uracil-5-)-methyltransferase [Moorella sp. (in: firmicutes)]MDK2894103.1 methylenetetrahydrofolate--tRNA-(uracil-5-)-methyltransferase [Moorella sp. (in: firmicutes)]GEA15231.1 methylenetetrahydrofolate--tRNA-(uracil-5-)-methyltransferase TrmFO [Moorella sp. E308F]GEA19908.1 methylenetetrahydrofolate-
MPEKLIIIGGGLAGSEAAWQAARRGIKVELWEMRPGKMTPAHRTGYLAELVCSNSLRADTLENAAGLLKAEMRLARSLIMAVAEECRVPAGKALAVDREEFAARVTAALEAEERITIIREEARAIPVQGPVIIATGPLTSPALAESLKGLTGAEYLYFYDAAAPIVTAESLNYSRIFKASRYGRGEEDYLNCPLNEEEYRRFYEALITAERHPRHEFEPEVVFEGCMPVEVMARRGPDTLRFGPMRPVGLIDPATGKEPYAVVQLRRDNLAGTLYNLVGFQTSLKWGEQERVFRLIPGLEEAEFVRFGVMHRNTYINSPRVLKPTLQLKEHPQVFLAGQLTGVEGYIESAASGLVAGVNAARLIKGQEPLTLPPATAHGALLHYITDPTHTPLQPMHINFGLLPPLERRVKAREVRNRALAERALEIWFSLGEFSGN